MMNQFDALKKFQVINNQQLSEVSGGKTLRITPWQLYNSKIHKYFGNHSAMWSATGRIFSKK